MNLPTDWSGWAGMAAVLSLLAALLYLALRSRMEVDFVTREDSQIMHNQNVGRFDALHADHTQLTSRVGKVEQRLSTMATRDDVSRVEARVTDLGSNIGEIKGVVDGLKVGQDRMFRQVETLTKALMRDGDK